jgi:2-oxoglutarate ferredoxin oxidoreductase subunit gamma
MNQRYRLVLSGSGGQGVITAAIILAEAAVIYEKRNAVQTQIYGAAARGGATRSDVIISDAVINYPKVNQPNILVCLTQEAYANFAAIIIRPGGMLITDPRFVTPQKKVDAMQYELPMYESVMDRIGKPIVFNICMLGAVIGLTAIVKADSVINTLATRIPKSFLSMNRQALEIGLALTQPQGCQQTE